MVASAASHGATEQEAPGAWSSPPWATIAVHLRKRLVPGAATANTTASRDREGGRAIAKRDGETIREAREPEGSRWAAPDRQRPKGRGPHGPPTVRGWRPRMDARAAGGWARTARAQDRADKTRRMDAPPLRMPRAHHHKSADRAVCLGQPKYGEATRRSRAARKREGRTRGLERGHTTKAGRAGLTAHVGRTRNRARRCAFEPRAARGELKKEGGLFRFVAVSLWCVCGFFSSVLFVRVL